MLKLPALDSILSDMAVLRLPRILMRRQKDFDESIFEVLLKAMNRALESGRTVEEAGEIAGEALQIALDESAPRVARTLVRTSPRMLRRYRSHQRRFERRKQWGRALDLFFIVVGCSEEVGREFDDRHTSAAVARQDFTFEALTGLHARACRVAQEVHHLLAGGYPLGALARCRTLHELAVTAMVIAEFGGDGGVEDLPRRFLEHRAVMAYKDDLVYQANCQVLGYEPFSDDDMAEMKAERDALVQRYGSTYVQQYGWASGLAGRRPTFMDLERLAEVSHLRGHYRWASHEVHSDAAGWAFNVYEHGGVSYKSTGVVNVGLADPGHMALISLHQSTVSLLLSAEDPSPRDMLALKTMQLLVDKAGEAFLEGERATAAADEQS
jgi:hypothetical protein